MFAQVKYRICNAISKFRQEITIPRIYRESNLAQVHLFLFLSESNLTQAQSTRNLAVARFNFEGLLRRAARFRGRR